MNNKILIIITLFIFIFFSGCISEREPPIEYQVVQVSKTNTEYYTEYHVIYYISNTKLTYKRDINTKDNIVIYSNKTRLVSECGMLVSSCWVLYVNESDVIKTN